MAMKSWAIAHIKMVSILIPTHATMMTGETHPVLTLMTATANKLDIYYPAQKKSRQN